jgi:signal transduction histidine kinase
MDKTKYRYILEGADKTWSDISGKASADYRNLSHGDYSFKVSSCGFNGKWSKPVEFRFTIRPPWWLSVWAYIIYGLILFTIIITADALQRSRLLAKERERTREKELAQAREIEKAYNELKTTQAQLIQSEKMASLGELTAGIAHEIQNPLNFVNNFSEVNTELIEEMKEQLAMDNKQQAIEIANDIASNEQKINHHGKRADAIVKGMLQHSRSSSGVKEPTDINALADEYLRLAYHGLRAKDKSFNAAMNTDFETGLEKINIVSQDIGRVILNLFTNAFYSVSAKKKLQIDGYEPIVSVSTKRLSGKVVIRVKDNGMGVPQKVLDKIFQPFFTTKPVGEGTGLGLSLSYDIIKAHGGELKVETKEDEGAEFIIDLPV